MDSIAIITARGGSRRIPGKNKKEFLGKPIIAYSIEAAKESGIFSDVIVSTDSEEIAEISEKYGASIPFMRSEKTASDYATTADVISEVLESLGAQGRSYEAFCCIYPTAPFITAEHLKKAQCLMTDSGADACVPVVRFSFPPQRGFVLKEGMLSYKWPEFRQARSQDLEAFYHDAGQFYFVRTQAFLKERSVVPERSVPMILPETQVQDIDNPEDWEIAEIKYKRLYLSGDGERKQEK